MSFDPAHIPPDEVCSLFEGMARGVWLREFRRYSADAILHEIRWRKHMIWGDREFKCNDNWTSWLARWFLIRNPECNGFFELRVADEEPLLYMPWGLQRAYPIY